MKIALSQINYHIGNFEQNTNKIRDAIRKAKLSDVNLIVFAELAVSGYPSRDFLEFDDFISCCNKVIDDISEEISDIAVIIGMPTVNSKTKGKNLYNSAVFIENGEITHTVNKTLLPTYDVFDEYRYFESGKEFNIINYKGVKIALTICEDLWDVVDDLMYTIRPMDELIKQQPDLIINIAASPFHYKQAEIRKQILKKNCVLYNLPLIYVNHVGAQTELLFDGCSMVLNSKGEVVEELKSFQEDFSIVELDEVNSMPIIKGEENSKMELLHDALIMGIKNYFDKLGFEKAILGLSGGIDSALTLVLAVRALGKENVKAFLLPSQYSSKHSIEDAVGLAKNLGIEYDMLSIEETYYNIENLLEPIFKGEKTDITEENIQSRLRAIILMAMSNKFGSILLNTSNKSEFAVGYGTLYGDMCGGISVLGDVYKTEVFELSRFINRNEEIIPQNTIIKPPSAELRANQKDSDSLPEYDILDKILEQYIENRKSPQEIINMGFDENIVKKTLRLVNTNEYKRYQSPPILRVSSKAFGMGRRMPIVARYLS